MVSAQQQGKAYKALALAAAKAADDKKGERITLYHVRPVTTVTDYMLLVSVTSPNHMKAVEEHVRTTLKSAGSYAQHRDGRESDVWRVLDYGGLLIHLMHPRAREFYDLDKLYHDARVVPWAPGAPADGKSAPARSAGAARKRRARG